MNTPVTEYPEDLSAPEERAAGLIFDWCVTSASFEVTPAVIEAKFGDGYAQRRPDGINTQSALWSVEIRNATPAIAATVLAFLSKANGVDVFNWTPPRTTIVQSVICPSWSSAYGEMLEGGTRLMNVTAKFQQVHV